MQSSYWSQIREKRIGRRRLLQISAGSSAGAALLAACGGSSDSRKPAGLVAVPADTSKQAKQGGVLKHYVAQDASGFDPSTSGSGDQLRAPAYSLLVRYAPSILSAPTNELVGDLAESWEYSPDHLTLTLKLRQGVTWHDRPPINGRAFDVQDVLFSFERASRVGSSRSEIFNSANANAPVLSVSSSNASTVTIKLAQPVFYVLSLFATNTAGRVNIVPKETDTTYDIRHDIIGTGPYVLDKYEPSVGITYRRNHEFYDKQGGYVDVMEMPIVVDYGQGLAQFRSGNIYAYDRVIGEDVLPTKTDVPQLAMYETAGFTDKSFSTTFGWLPAGKSPFLDERVRQAYSKSIDRELWLDVVYNVAKFRDAGLRVETQWNSACFTSDAGWVDPRSDEFGSDRKYFEHDVAEAKALLSAAGYSSGLDVVSTFPTNSIFGPDYTRQVQVTEGMAREAGFRPVTRQIDYQTEFLRNYRYGPGEYEGWTHRTMQGGQGEGLLHLYANYNTKVTSTFLGFSLQGKSDRAGDPYIDTQLEKALLEFDRDARNEMTKDMQRYVAKSMYEVKWPGLTTGFKLAWPVVRNFNVFQVLGGKPRPEPFYWWLDPSEAPLKKT